MDEGPRTQCKGICKGAAHAFRILILVFSLPVVCSRKVNEIPTTGWSKTNNYT